MKTNELRIGNWFKSNIYQQVTIEHLEFLLNDSIKDKSIMQPIPLTEDVLVKLPRWFKDLIDDGYFNLNELPNGYVDVKYLHTAQNLYFALTGEELNIIL